MNATNGTEAPEFGVVLARLRRRVRISQSKLAERADFDHSFVSRLENGNRQPTREAVGRLARALGLDDEDAAGLYAAAGFLHRVDVDPLVRRLSTVLGDETVPPVVRQRVRTAVEVCVEHGERRAT